MSTRLLNKHIAILSAEGFEQVELTEPKKALEDAGAHVSVVSLKAGEIQGMKHADKGDNVPVDITLDKADPNDFDALMLPGGLINPDTLRSEPKALDFVRTFFLTGKPVAAICHGPQVLISAGVLKGRKLTSWPAIQDDVRNAGAQWVDAEVFVDNGLVTSRKPDDIPAFNRKMIEEFAEGVHAKQREMMTHPS
ncbi:MAG: type 1 glutamine amidotransferase [Verrucomicrobiaceae bacterium]|nr:MAG: type 1 glutamine amidotransferase [Verrucomicrobiaceae bacterium]